MSDKFTWEKDDVYMLERVAQTADPAYTRSSRAQEGPAQGEEEQGEDEREVRKVPWLPRERR